MADEAPESPPMVRDDVLRVLASVDGRAVLVGGQAVGWWVERYAGAGRLPELDSVHALYVSKDIDFLASGDPKIIEPLVQKVAHDLGGRVTSPSKTNWTSLLSHRVLFAGEDHVEREVDFLRNTNGVDRREVFDTAVRFDADVGFPTVYVMNPEVLFRSRILLAVEFEDYRTDAKQAQAIVAAAILREWLVDQLDQAWARAHVFLERTLNLATSKDGRWARKNFGVDAMSAIPATHPNYPDAFLSQRLSRVRASLAIED
jgi:hypothetical protein